MSETMDTQTSQTGLPAGAASERTPATTSPGAQAAADRARLRRAYWLRTMAQWHWISSAICLVGMLLFSITGITLNHAGEIATTPEVVSQTVTLPRPLLQQLNGADVTDTGPLPREVSDWLGRELSLAIGTRAAEWSDFDVYVSMPGPGVDAWLAIDRETGDVEYERTDRGWIAYFNDLHKGRNTGTAWKWFIDLFAVASLVFCVTGLALLYFHARKRAMTWPLVGLGLIAPLLLALWSVH